MSLYAISDLHLSFADTVDKPMDKFGPGWEGHPQSLEKAWREAVRDEDIVLVPGDISWALKIEEAMDDFEWIHNLPGLKILSKGNHDLWCFGYLHDELGIELHREPVVKTIKGKKFFLVHGDGRGPGDRGYKFLKKVFELKPNQWMFKWLHPDLGIGLALRWSHNHRLKKLKNEVERGYYDDIPNTRLYQYAQEQAKLDPSIDFFVFGHQHKPMQYKTGDHALTTVVGNWIYDFTYAVFDGETVEFKKFES